MWLPRKCVSHVMGTASSLLWPIIAMGEYGTSITRFSDFSRKGSDVDFYVKYPTFQMLESIMLSEISQVVRDKYHMISPLAGSFLKKMYDTV